MTLSGFEEYEINDLLKEEVNSGDNEEESPLSGKKLISKPNDIWILKNSRIFCGQCCESNLSYIDFMIRKWQDFMREKALRQSDRKTFDRLEAEGQNGHSDK